MLKLNDKTTNKCKEVEKLFQVRGYNCLQTVGDHWSQLQEILGKLQAILIEYKKFWSAKEMVENRKKYNNLLFTLVRSKNRCNLQVILTGIKILKTQ